MKLLIHSLLTLAIMFLGFYIILWGINPNLKHPVRLVTDGVKRLIKTTLTFIWTFITAIFSFLFSRKRRPSKTVRHERKTYENALSLTSLNSKVLKRPAPVTHTLDTWNTHLENVHIAPSEYYGMLQSTIKDKSLSDIRIKFIYSKQGGLFSAKRKYLRITRGSHVFDICAAPFGNGIFVSWWLGMSFSGLFGFIARRRFIGPLVVWIFGRFIKPPTYYRIDTARVFQKVIHAAVLDVHTLLTGEDQSRFVEQLEKPVLKELYP